MSDEHTNDPNEARLREVLRALDADTAPVDRSLLDALRERALTAFGESASPGAAPALSKEPPVRLARSLSYQRKRHPMITLAIRGAVALAGLAAAIVVGLNLTGHGRLSGAMPFADVLENLRGLKTLELQVTKEGRKAEVWIRAPGLVRWEESPQRYQIAIGSRLWKIDETANTAVADSPWFIDPKRQVDLLGLLDVGIKESGPLLNAKPIERGDYAGQDCFVFRVDLPATEGKLEITAYADAAKKQLVAIVARPAGVVAAGPPLAELRLVAMNPPIDETKFVVAKSLTDDGRIGKVNDAQGIVVVRPALAQRWTPVCRELSLRTGDWLRTDIRGANAVKARLSSDVELTLGPGTLVEFITPSQARLHVGEVQVNLPKQENVAFELLAPHAGSQKFAGAGKSILRVDRDEKLAEVKQTPKWLAGFEGTSNDESLGSLIVKVDGRDVPLAVGYHKVNVEIRDQIARTTIEESFVNTTNTRLEGVFYFPLPQDASISDFGMWIGNNLVEADVVEKQRAREIYETILRERRDPGLLEWTGGNIFKARVFPIEAQSEKRIKIVYTQVLPLRANRYRYSYGLRSELLRTKPLRELDLTVTVNSALPLKSVTCPTHSARVEQSGHSAQLAFTAQEYTPTRDFEVVCEVDGRQSDVVVVPHRRGDDGYFLVQLTPPSPEGNWQREVVADGKPLELVLLCDTSASMDNEKRKQQAEFVATILSSLSEKDHFWLAGVDVSTVWESKESIAATAENIAKARDFLEHRLSLGWTNLEQAFEAVLKRAPAGAQVVYIGDGIVTAGEADPDGFVKRLARLMTTKGSGVIFNRTSGDGSRLAGSGVEKDSRPLVLHAVTVGNSFESTVLKAIAGLGGGSVRSVGGDQTPQSVAFELLKEIASPGLRDLNVEFRGLKVAAVYPDRLPNLAAGTQQILVGRYLPTGNDQQGEIVVTGHRGTETIRYAGRIDLKDAEAGNSFIPRLWARAHLDHLLAQGQSQAVRDEIIALSEEFHIMTPYTSLLVLETDADRERFGVKRRFAMRNGEQFFAAGHDNASYELSQQQMKKAGDWRIGLRRQVLANLSRLGRDPQLFERMTQRYRRFPEGRMSGLGWGGGGGAYAGVGGTDSYSLTLNGVNNYSGLTTVAGGIALDGSSSLGDVNGEFEFSSRLGADAERLSDSPEPAAVAGPESAAEQLDVGLKAGQGELDLREKSEFAGRLMAGDDAKSIESFNRGDGDRDGSAPFALDMTYNPALLPASGPMSPLSDESTASRGTEVAYALGKPVYWRYQSQPNYTAWLDTLFPTLPPPAREPQPSKPSTTWSPEAVELSKSLLRTEALKKLDGGIELRTVSESFDPRWNRRTSRHAGLQLYSTKAWLTRPLDLDVQTIINFCNSKERGAYSLALLLGRERTSVNRDLATPSLELSDWSLSRLDEAYRGYEAKVIKSDAPDRAVLALTIKNNSDFEQRFTIDTARHVLVKIETLDKGKVTSTTTLTDFVQLAGGWWARKVTTIDAKERNTGETTLEVSALAANKFSERVDAELKSKPYVQFLQVQLPKLKDARQHVADGSATFDDRIVMMLYDASLQQWDELLKQLDAIEKAAADKPGVRWLRPILLATMRRNEEAQQRLLDEARRLAERGAEKVILGREVQFEKQPDELYLAGFLLGQAQGVTSPAEYLQFVELLKPVYDRQPDELGAKTRWREELAGTYDRLGRTDEMLALKRALAEEAPWDTNKQIDYARRLMQAGQGAAAYQWLDKQLDRPVEREKSDDDSLRTAYADFYRSQARWEELLRFTTKWIDRKPESSSPYLQHLSALVYNDRLDDAIALGKIWLKEAEVEDKFTADQEARFDAAISFAEGNAYNLSFYRMDERWNEPFAEAIRFFARSKRHVGLVNRLLDYRFSESDFGDRARGDFLNLLQTKLADLSAEQVNLLVGQTLSGRLELAEPLDGRLQLNASEVPDRVWRSIVDQLRPRWKQLDPKTDKDAKHQLGEALRGIYNTRFHDKELLPFLRERLATAADEYKAAYLTNLFDTLLTWKWSEEIENEAFGLLHRLAEVGVAPVDGPEPAAAGTPTREIAAGDRLTIEVPALYRLVDSMLTARQAAADEKLHDAGKVNELTRAELAAKKAGFRKAARQGLAARLAAETDKETGPLAPWLRIERAYLDIQLDQNLDGVAAECWQILDKAPPKRELDAEQLEELPPEQLRQRFFDALLHQRAFITAMNLAARKNAAPALVERLRKYIDAGIALGGDQAAGWRAAKFQLLVALDRPDDLERELREWIRADVSTGPWRKALAMLLAERGKFDEAIALFEAAEKDHLLTAADYRSFADWYLVTARRDAYERSRLEAFKLLPERSMANLLNSLRYRWMRTDLPLPSELDENTLLALRALFEKSAQPENYLSELHELYTACRDFRLLEMLPDAVVGRSPQQIYAFLANLQSQILGEIHNEATVDEIVARIKKLREGKLTPTDQRALDLFEAVVERRASEVLNQPGPHVAACLAALQRAFERQWGEGEPRMMASFLRGLGTLRDPKLIDEQLRELRALANMTPAAGRDHLYITRDLCDLLFNSYGLHDEAIEQMEAEVRAYDQAHGGRWPFEDDDVLGSYVSLLEGAQRFVAGETVLQKYLAKPEHAQQKAWLKDRLLQLDNNALDQNGEVSLGKGNGLFRAIAAEAQRRLNAAADENERQSVISAFTNTLDIAHRHNLPDSAEQVKKFAFETIPAVLKRQQSQYQSTVTTPLRVVEAALGPKNALRYVVERLEQYPAWLELGWNNGWQTFGWELGRLRETAETSKLDIEDLEPRVLKLTIRELKRDLLGQDRRNPQIYYRNYQHFWTAKAGDFAAAANEVYREHKGSGRRVVYIAGYLWSGLELHARAIEIMLDAHKDGVLDESGEVQLVDYLHGESRFGESIAILEPLVKDHPDAMQYRTRLMTAYYRTQRHDQLDELVRDMDKHFHQGGLWNEGTIAEFGRGALDCHLFNRAVDYYKQAISLHQRNNPASGNGDNGLSYMYQQLADGYSQLGQIKEAVDAASAAIVCWGPHQAQRRDAINKLGQVLANAKDLDAYVRGLDESNKDSPILRKAIGHTYQARGKFDKAIVQLRLAADMQPADVDVHQALVACYDALGKKHDGTLELLAVIDLDRHNLALYQQLADRLKDDEAEAERAATSIIEAGPHEAENQAAMAELRQKQGRWNEAIPHWQQAADLRRLEPTNLVKLIEAELHAKQWDAARQSLRKLQQTDWPSRFNSVENDIRRLLDQLSR